MLTDSELQRVRDTRSLTRERTKLCDLLIGRQLRYRAAEVLRRGLEIEPDGRFVDDHLDAAAHHEWMAERAERGEILWGGRFNRCGYQPLRDP